MCGSGPSQYRFSRDTMVGQLCGMRIGVSTIQVFQRLSDARMQPHLAAEGEPVVEGLLDQAGTPEACCRSCATCGRLKPDSATRWKAGARTSRPSVSARGWRLETSI